MNGSANVDQLLELEPGGYSSLHSSMGETPGNLNSVSVLASSFALILSSSNMKSYLVMIFNS